MYTGLSNQAFDTLGFFGDALGVRVGIVEFSEFPGLGVAFGGRVEDVMQLMSLPPVAAGGSALVIFSPTENS